MSFKCLFRTQQGSAMFQETGSRPAPWYGSAVWLKVENNAKEKCIRSRESFFFFTYITQFCGVKMKS